MVNLELYRVFYTVAKCGSLTRAAEELYISQPAVSQSVKQLETQLGVSLFNRTHRGMELSEHGGKIIFAKVEKALQLFDEAKNQVRLYSSSVAGTLRIGVSADVFNKFLLNAVQECRRKHPALSIQTVSDFGGVEGLKEGKVDIAFLEEDFSHECPVIEKAFSIREKAVASPSFAKSGSSISLAELKNTSLLLTKNSERALNRYGVKVQAVVLAESDLAVKNLCINGVGIGVLPEEYVREEIRQGLLEEIAFNPALPPRSVYLAYVKNEKTADGVEAFLTALHQEN